MLKLSVSVDESWTGASRRAAEDVAGGRIARRIKDNWYAVPSNSQPGLEHMVSIENLGALKATCDCLWAQSGRKSPCRHVAQVLDSEIRRVSRKPVAPVAPLAAPEPLVAPDRQADWFRAQRARASA